MSSLPSVTISLVNWNGLSHTRECVRHCLELDYPHFDLVIVDNGSSDGSFHFWDRPDTIWYAGGMLEKQGRHASVHRGQGEFDNGQYRADEEVEFITGCSLLIRAATVRDIHFISDQYFVEARPVVAGVCDILLGRKGRLER